ncbi:hypothetical protein HYPSUDRAFT_209851, partial [Hypholoma sublateritium FD-334 SS-4]
ETHFLALDKGLPQREFLEVIDIAAPISTTDAPLLAFDPEWLTISEARALVAQERAWVNANVKADARGALPIGNCQTFKMTTPVPGSEGEGANKLRQPPWYTNPQTEVFCRMLDIPNKINPPPTLPSSARSPSPPPPTKMAIGA